MLAITPSRSCALATTPFWTSMTSSAVFGRSGRIVMDTPPFDAPSPAYARPMARARPQLTPYLYYPDATIAQEFLVRAFGFEVVSELRDKDGTVWTSTIRLGDAWVMIGPGLEGFGTAAVAEVTSDCGSQQWIFAQRIAAEPARPN
jgi:hypothetical protein